MQPRSTLTKQASSTNSTWDNLGYWNAPTASHSVAAAELAWRLWDLVAPVSAPRVLDVASGFGAQLGFWRRLGAAEVDAYEPNKQRAKAAVRAYAGDPAVRVRRAPAADVGDLPSETRDVALVLDALYPFPDRQRFFSEVAGVLEVGGRFAFCTLVGPDAAAPTHTLRLLSSLFKMPGGLPTPTELGKELGRAGFADVRVVDWTEPVLGGFSANGKRAIHVGSSKRRRARVAITRRGCRAAMAMGVRYVGVSATACGPEFVDA